MLTIVYDNYSSRKDLTTGWGFGCVVQGLEKTILFDTGADGSVLLENMRRCGLDAGQIDAVVLSHIHGDHTGGLEGFLRARPRGGGSQAGALRVYMPAGFPKAFKEKVSALGGDPREADDSELVCPGARTSGTLGRGAIEEHSLCIKTADGWVMITGCAHPGVADLAARGAEVVGEPVRFVLGGFHMGGYSAGQIETVIDRLEKLGVRRAGPCHCSGDTARKLFKERLGERCVLPGVGEILRFEKAP